MSYRQIKLHNIGIYFPQKVCFEGLNASIHHKERIGIIGRNASGKSLLLKTIQGIIEPETGQVTITEGVSFGYIPQTINSFDNLSGGQRFNKKLSQALNKNPNVLCLDEPTNHLDISNRKSLIRMLKAHQGTLIVVSHDAELLRNCIDKIWHIEDGKIHFFSGNYDNYKYYWQKQRENLELKLSKLERENKKNHLDLMREQERAKKRRIHGEKKYKDDKMALRAAQGQGELTTGKKKREISHQKESILQQLTDIHLPEIIKPKFNLSYTENSKNKVIISISGGSCSYNSPILYDINLQIKTTERVAILGDNASGKSTLIKAIHGNSEVKIHGDWNMPNPQDIGYLDQHYNTLKTDYSAFATIKDIVPQWEDREIRKFLNDFLFRKNEEVNAKVSTLSGGEKARLSLAQIAAQSPKLLILDEVTNNLDLETKEHIIQVLTTYPGALVVISHDEDFLKRINIDTFYEIRKQQLVIK